MHPVWQQLDASVKQEKIGGGEEGGERGVPGVHHPRGEAGFTVKCLGMQAGPCREQRSTACAGLHGTHGAPHAVSLLPLPASRTRMAAA